MRDKLVGWLIAWYIMVLVFALASFAAMSTLVVLAIIWLWRQINA